MSATSSCKRALRTGYFRCCYLSLFRRKIVCFLLAILALLILTMMSQTGPMTSLRGAVTSQAVHQSGPEWRPSLRTLVISPGLWMTAGHSPPRTFTHHQGPGPSANNSSTAHGQSQSIFVNDSSQRRQNKNQLLSVDASQRAPNKNRETVFDGIVTKQRRLHEGQEVTAKPSQTRPNDSERVTLTAANATTSNLHKPHVNIIRSEDLFGPVQGNAKPEPPLTGSDSSDNLGDNGQGIEEQNEDADEVVETGQNDITGGEQMEEGPDILVNEQNNADLKEGVNEEEEEGEEEEEVKVTRAVNRHSDNRIRQMLFQKRLFAQLHAEQESEGTEDGYNSEDEVHRVFFLKVHKAASTTVMNILYRFALRRKLKVMLPKHGNVLSENKKYWMSAAIPRMSGISSFNILCNHVVFTESAVRLAVGRQAKLIGIVREPFQQFVSAFYYYRNKFGTKYLTRIPGKDPVETYLKNPEIFEARRVSGSFTYNRMSFDFGMSPHMMSNERSVDMYVSYLDRTFDLVMVKERFDESMVLMKRLLGWQLQDVLYIKNNVFTNQRGHHANTHGNYTQQQKLAHQEFNVADYRLYEHFVSVFERKVEEEGEQFQQEVAAFVALREKVEEFCQRSVVDGAFAAAADNNNGDYDDRFTLPATNWTSEFQVSRTDCELMTLQEVPFVNLMRSWQYGVRMANGYSRRLPPHLMMQRHSPGSGDYDYEQDGPHRHFEHVP